MSSDSEQSSFERELPQPNLKHIWNNIQKTKTLSQMLDKSPQYQKPLQQYQKRQPQQEYQDNIAHLLRTVRTLEKENQILHSKLDLEKQQRQQEVQVTRKEYEEKLKAQMRKMKMADKQNLTSHKAKDQVENLKKENQRLLLKLKALEIEHQQYQTECKRLTQVNQLCMQKIGENQQMQGLEGRAEQLLELEQANSTISRLVQLLRRTEAYKQYAPLMQEVGDMHYLKNILRRLKSNQLNFKPIHKKVCRCQSANVEEKLLWSPTECYKIMLAMKMKYDYLNEDCIEEVLFELNRIYNVREQKNLQKIKMVHSLEINKLKKQIDTTYDEVLTKKQIARLKKELKGTKSTNKSKQPQKMDHLKDKGQLGDQLKLQQKQIKLLKERIQLFESENNYQDKTLYFEGILYALDKILAELESNEGNMKEFEVRFRDKLEDNVEPEQWLASYKQFFQTLAELNSGLLERVLGLKQSVLQKIGQND